MTAEAPRTPPAVMRRRMRKAEPPPAGADANGLPHAELPSPRKGARPSDGRCCSAGQEVSWLGDHPTPGAFPSRAPGWRARTVATAGFVPPYSCGAAEALTAGDPGSYPLPSRVDRRPVHSTGCLALSILKTCPVISPSGGPTDTRRRPDGSEPYSPEPACLSTYRCCARTSRGCCGYAPVPAGPSAAWAPSPHTTWHALCFPALLALVCGKMRAVLVQARAAPDRLVRGP